MRSENICQKTRQNTQETGHKVEPLTRSRTGATYAVRNNREAANAHGRRMPRKLAQVLKRQGRKKQRPRDAWTLGEEETGGATKG